MTQCREIFFSTPADPEKRDRLMQTVDSLNRTIGPDLVKFGALGLKPTWTMRADYFSKRYTTHWQELPKVTVWHSFKTGHGNNHRTIQKYPGQNKPCDDCGVDFMTSTRNVYSEVTWHCVL